MSVRSSKNKAESAAVVVPAIDSASVADKAAVAAAHPGAGEANLDNWRAKLDAFLTGFIRQHDIDIDIISREVVTMSISEISNLMADGRWVTDSAYQRTEKSGWSDSAYTDAVYDSLLRGVGFGTILVNKVTLKDGNVIYSVIDGAHRSRFLSRALAGNIRWRKINVIDNVEFMRAFGNIRIDVVVYDNLSETDCAELFTSINGGIALSPFEQLRSRVQKVLALTDVSASIVALAAVMPKRAGKTVARELVEEIILQSVSGRMGSYSYTGKEYTSYLADAYIHKQDALLAAAAAVRASVIAFCKDASSADKPARGFFKKTLLNVLFLLDYKSGYDDWIRLGRLVHNSDGYHEAVIFGGFCKSASASSVSVKERLMSITRHMDGKGFKTLAEYTAYNVAVAAAKLSDDKAAAVAAGKAIDAEKAAAADNAAAAKALAAVIKDTQNVNNQTNLPSHVMIYDFLIKYGEVNGVSSPEYVNKLMIASKGKNWRVKSSSGGCQISYVINGATYTKTWDDFVRLFSGKIK